MGSEVTAPRILTFAGDNWSVTCFTTNCITCEERKLNPLNRMLGGPQIQFGCFGETKTSRLYWKAKPSTLVISQQPDLCTNWTITGAVWMKTCGKSRTTSPTQDMVTCVIFSEQRNVLCSSTCFSFFNYCNKILFLLLLMSLVY